MTARISHTTVDSTDPVAQSVFWSAVLGFAEARTTRTSPGTSSA